MDDMKETLKKWEGNYNFLVKKIYAERCDSPLTGEYIQRVTKFVETHVYIDLANIDSKDECESDRMKIDIYKRASKLLKKLAFNDIKDIFNMDLLEKFNKKEAL